MKEGGKRKDDLGGGASTHHLGPRRRAVSTSLANRERGLFFLKRGVQLCNLNTHYSFF